MQHGRHFAEFGKVPAGSHGQNTAQWECWGGALTSGKCRIAECPLAWNANVPGYAAVLFGFFNHCPLTVRVVAQRNERERGANRSATAGYPATVGPPFNRGGLSARREQ
jgi:hypothetical protein